MSDKHVAETLNEAQMLAIAMAIAPTVINAVVADLDYRFDTLAAIQKDQDRTTTGIFNMAPLPNTSTPPRAPHPDIVIQRHELEVVKNYVMSLKAGCLEKCKTHTEPNGDGSTETKIVIDAPESAKQRKFTNYVKSLDFVINQLQEIPEKETQRFIDDFRPDSIIHRTISQAFLGRVQGQRHMSLSDKERAGILRSFKGQGLITNTHATREEDQAPSSE